MTFKGNRKSEQAFLGLRRSVVWVLLLALCPLGLWFALREPEHVVVKTTMVRTTRQTVVSGAGLVLGDSIDAGVQVNASDFVGMADTSGAPKPMVQGLDSEGGRSVPTTGAAHAEGEKLLDRMRSGYRAEVKVGAEWLVGMTVGRRAFCALQAIPDWRIPARISVVSPSYSAQDPNIRVELEFEVRDPRIQANMAVRADFLVDDPRSGGTVRIAIPKTALRQQGGVNRVYVVSADRIAMRRVTLLTVWEQTAIISSGLAPGDRVIVGGPENLRPGMIAQEE